MVVARHAQSTQNNKHAVSLQYLRKEMRYEVDICMLIKMKVFYRLIVLFLMDLARHAQITCINLQCLCEILQKKPGIKLGT